MDVSMVYVSRITKVMIVHVTLVTVETCVKPVSTYVFVKPAVFLTVPNL